MKPTNNYTMRGFLTILILIFSLHSWTKADDISDFQIEGMSIGDSLLKFYKIDKINSAPKAYYPKSKKHYIIEISDNFKTYDVEYLSLFSSKK